MYLDFPGSPDVDQIPLAELAVGDYIVSSSGQRVWRVDELESAAPRHRWYVRRAEVVRNVVASTGFWLADSSPVTCWRARKETSMPPDNAPHNMLRDVVERGEPIVEQPTPLAIAERRVAELEAKLAQFEQDTELLGHLLLRAADEHELCSVFDDEVGSINKRLTTFQLPYRPKPYDISIMLTVRADAIPAAIGVVAQSIANALAAHGDNLGGLDYTVIGVDVDDYDEV